MKQLLKDYLRALAYSTGVLGLAHRIRNRRTLSVFMFHRVLPEASVEYKYAEKEFTFSESGFSRCLDFISKNYNVVSHQTVFDHLVGKKNLPDRAALITFDDGWRDTVLYALPELRKRSLPSVMFLATEVVGLKANRWWQDTLVAIVAQPSGLEFIEQKIGSKAAVDADRIERLRYVTAEIAARDDEERHRILKSDVNPPEMPRQMVSLEDIEAIRSDIAIAGHGHSHAPLPYCKNGLADIKQSMVFLINHQCDAWAMSLPHGSYNQDLLNSVFASGFKYCYSSEAKLVNTSIPLGEKNLIGRIHIPENWWTCDSLGLSAAKLATFLFFRPIDR